MPAGASTTRGGSWAHGNEYILLDLGWNYQPGCVFMSYESFNGTDFDDSDGIQRRGQGQIADFSHGRHGGDRQRLGAL